MTRLRPEREAEIRKLWPRMVGTWGAQTFPDLLREIDALRAEGQVAGTDEQIKYMVNRFLVWRLPENFNPDGGISFKPDFNENTPWPMKNEPTGTNLFDATQAEVMIRYLVTGLPSERVSAEELAELIAKWRNAAIDSREESDRIRRTVHVATYAEANCMVRAEVWCVCADELEAILRPTHTPESGEKL